MRTASILLCCLVACAEVTTENLTPCPEPSTLPDAAPDASPPGDTFIKGTRLEPVFVRASDGTVIQETTRWWDTVRGEECRWLDVSVSKRICLPRRAERWDIGLYADAACKTPAARFPACDLNVSATWDVTAGLCGQVDVVVNQLGPEPKKVYAMVMGACQPVPAPELPDGWVLRAAGQEVPLSEFVSAVVGP